MAFCVELMFHPHVEMHIFELRSLSVLKRSTFLPNGSWKEKELNAIRFNRHFPSLVIRDQRHIVQSKIFHQGWFISGMRFCWEANGQKGAGDTQCCSVPQTCGSGEGSSVKVNCDTAVSSNQWKQCGRTLELGIVGPLWSARSVCFVFLVSTLSLAHLNNALKAGILEKIFLATFTDLLTTQSQLVWSFESQNWVKVKVVTWCWKKWNKHNLMYIYHKQCEIKQKIQWNSSNGQLHWFPIDSLWKWSKRDQNYGNANAFFLGLENGANKYKLLKRPNMCFFFEKHGN